MNSKRTEGIAVNAIRNKIYENEYLADEIPTNDKTPSWDGEIWVYDNEDQPKNSLFGKVPVQVKGKKVNEFSSDSIKYSLEKADLENYYKNNGILFFVVEYINPSKTQIYYLELLTVDIKPILNEMNEKGTQTIRKKFNRLSSELRSLEFICRNFIFHSRKQAYSLIENVKNVEDSFKSFKCQMVFTTPEKIYDDLLTYGTYAYGRIDEHNIDVPLYKINIEEIIEEANVNIGINGKKYYQAIRYIRKDEVSLKFGKSFEIIFPKNYRNDEYFDIKFKENGSLTDRINDSKFMLELIKYKKIEINDLSINLNKKSNHNEQKLLNELPRYIKHLEELQESFNKLNINFNLNLKQLNKKEIRKMNILKEVILNKNFSLLKTNQGDQPFIHLDVAGYKIGLVSTYISDGKLIFDLFDLDSIKEKFMVKASSKDEKQHTIHSPYLMFKVDELYSFDNLRINVIEESLKQAQYENDFCFALTNQFLLDSLSYYDKNSDRKEILTMVLNMFEFLVNLQPENNIYFLNKMQVIKRMREFNLFEKESIVNRKLRINSNDLEILCGFLILLGNKMEFDLFFSKLPKDKQKTFKSYPIYNLISSHYFISN